MQSKSFNLPIWTVGAVLCVLAAMLGFWIGNDNGEKSVPGKAIAISDQTTRLSPAKAISDFILMDQQRQPFTRERLKSHWSLVFFGYANCPDVCPTTLTVLKNSIQRIIQSDNGTEPPQVVFISIDPQRDTPEFLDDYIGYFSEDFIAVTGSEQELLKVSMEMNVIYMKTGNVEGDNYLMDHSASILLLNPDAELAAIISAPHTAEALSEDVIRIIQQG